MVEPNITIIYKKNGRSRYLRDSATKIKRRTSVSFLKRAKLGDFDRLSVRVVYGKDKGELVTNHLICETYSDLTWAINAFLDRDLWLR